jgi:hypothetical protein
VTSSDSIALALSAGPASREEIAHEGFELDPEKRVISCGFLDKIAHGAFKQESKKRVG